jgi:hypothetical protein
VGVLVRKITQGVKDGLTPKTKSPSTKKPEATRFYEGTNNELFAQALRLPTEPEVNILARQGRSKP